MERRRGRGHPYLTASEATEIKAGVQSCFAKSGTLYRIGSLKWLGRAKWGEYIAIFRRVANQETYSYQMSPLEYVDAWERDPRFMAIMDAIQSAFITSAATERDKARDAHHR